MGERSGAPSGFSPASIVISKPPVAVQLPQPDVSANRDAPQIRLLVDDSNDPNFVEAYATAMSGEQWRPPAPLVTPPATTLQKALPRTFRALCEDYLAFLARDPRVSKRTKYTRRQHLEHVCREPTKPGAPYVMG